MQMISVDPNRLRTLGDLHQHGSSQYMCHNLGFEKFPAERVALLKHCLKNPIRFTNGLWIVPGSSEHSPVSNMLLTTILLAAISAASVCARWIDHTSSGLRGKIRTVVTTDMEQDDLASLVRYLLYTPDLDT